MKSIFFFIVISVFLFGASAMQKNSQDNRVCQPIASLPEHIFADSGRLTLFADFDHRRNGDVPIYVVNRSGKPITLSAQEGITYIKNGIHTFGSGNIYVKLEYEEAPGKWTRAEPHAFSWCGNSYSKMVLDKDSYLLVYDSPPGEGIMAKVRYSFYHQDVRASSNCAEAFINKRDVERAANDALAVYSGDFAFVRKVALGEVTLKNEMDHINDLRKSAIWRLARGEFDPTEAERVLKSIAEGTDREYAQEAERILERLRTKRQNIE